MDGKKIDPLKRLGFGIDMYLKIQWQLVLIFALFSVLLIPVFVFYGRNDAYTFYTTVNGV